MKTILISGANGFLATNFMLYFSKKYHFLKLSHKPQSGHITFEELEVNESLIKSIDVIINLAGANIGDKRWSIERKNELLISRIKTTLQLALLFNKAGAKAHFISASAVGVYPVIQENDEDTLINNFAFSSFSQQLTRQWENTVKMYKGKLTITRFGVVLSGYGGAFPKMLRPFLFYMGGPLGSGEQYFPWISLIDLVNALDFILDKSQTGVYNLVAPQIISNNQLSGYIAQIWHRPNWFRMPEPVIKMLFGQMGQELFLNSLHVKSKRLTAENFNYLYPDIQSCLMAIKAKKC